MNLQIFIGALVSLLLWFLIGMERQKNLSNPKNIAWARTFSLIWLLWYILGLIAKYTDDYLFVLLGIFSVVVLLGISMYLSYQEYKNFGITTEISILLIYICGVLISIWYQDLAVLVWILTLIVLYIYDHTQNLSKVITNQEILDSIKFAIIAFVVLPLLPNQDYGMLGEFNPYNTMKMVVLISGIWFVWYILTRLIWTTKWLGLTWLIWWIVSSTAVTSSMSEMSKKVKNLNPLAFAVIIASSIMFVRVAIEIKVTNTELFRKILPILISMIVVSVLWWLIYFLFGKKQEEKEEKVTIENTSYSEIQIEKKNQPKIDIKSPFALKPALFFGLFYAFIIIISKRWLHIFWEKALYIISFISALTDVDAIVLSTSKQNIDSNVAIIVIMIAVITNTAVKLWIAYMFGSRSFWNKLLIVIWASILAWLWAMFFVL